MSSLTPKYALPYPVAADAVNQEPVTIKALADRMDLLLGESGFGSVAAVANTAFAVPIVLARTYPGNSGATAPGWVGVSPFNNVGSGVTVFYWTDTFTGTATTITGFTIRGISSTTATRSFVWRFLPVL